MKNIYWILFLPLLSGCFDNKNPSAEETTYYENARIDIDFPYIFSGDSVVFKRFYKKEDKEEIADDEYAEDFIFQIPSGISEFNYSGEQLIDLKLTFKQYCFCMPSEGITIESGTISGMRVGDQWNIAADVNLKNIYRYNEDSTFVGQETINKTFSGNFSKKSIPSAN